MSSIDCTISELLTGLLTKNTSMRYLQNIFLHWLVEQYRLLRHQTHLIPQPTDVKFSDIGTVQKLKNTCFNMFFATSWLANDDRQVNFLYGFQQLRNYSQVHPIRKNDLVFQKYFIFLKTNISSPKMEEVHRNESLLRIKIVFCSKFAVLHAT